MELPLLKLVILLHLCSVVRLIDDSLVMVHVVFRHCDRTPDKKELASIPFYNESNFAPYGYGQLTNEGKKRCYNLGKALRQRYDGFLQASYHHSLIEGRSSYYVRTKESLQLVLAGLFPPTKELIWMDGMNWIPVATYYDKLGEDKVLHPVSNPVYIKEILRYRQLQEYKAIEAKYAGLIANVSKQVGEPMDLQKLAYLNLGTDFLMSLGFTLPTWLRSLYPSPLADAFKQFYSSLVATNKLKKLFGGYLLKKIIEDTDRKINGTLDPRDRKMFIYGGHDFNILILLNLLDSLDSTTPPFGSSIVFEVHKITGIYGFKIFYFRDFTKEPETISLPGFSGFHPLNEFKLKKREFLDFKEFDENSPSVRLTGSLALIIILLSTCSQL